MWSIDFEQPGRLDDIGQIAARLLAARFSSNGIGTVVPGGLLAAAREGRIEAKFCQIADEKARSRPGQYQRWRDAGLLLCRQETMRPPTSRSWY